MVTGIKNYREKIFLVRPRWHHLASPVPGALEELVGFAHKTNVAKLLMEKGGKYIYTVCL